MNTPPNAPRSRIILRYAGLLGLLAILTTGGILTIYFIKDHTAIWVYWAIGLWFLRIVQIVYTVAPAAAIVTLALVVRGLRRQRNASGRDRLWKAAALSGSVLLGSLILEGAAAWVLNRQDQSSALPAGTEQDLLNEKVVSGAMPNEIQAVVPPKSFPEESDDVRIAVLGESSAEGVPFTQWFSFGGLIADGLSEAMPQRTFRTEVLALSGRTLEDQHRWISRLQHRPDVLIVFAGHNEFSARIPVSRDLPYYLDAQQPGLLERTLTALTSWSRFQVLVRRNIEKCRIAIPPPANGRRALVDSPAYTPKERETLLEDFRRRLEALADFAESLGAILVLIAPAANDSGFDPNRSYLPPETPLAERKEVEAAFQAAVALEASDPAASEQGQEAILARQPAFAASHWRLSRLLAARGEFARAYQHAVAARDFDGYPMRLPTDFQNLYRDLARRRSCIFIDAQTYFHAMYPDGLLDERLFHDAMHPSFRGYLALVQGVLRGLYDRRAFGWPADAPPPVLDTAASVLRYLKNDPNVWVYLCRWGMMSSDITARGTYDPTFRRSQRDSFQRAADAIEAGTPANQAGRPGIDDLAPIPVVPLNDLNPPQT